MAYFVIAPENSVFSLPFCNGYYTQARFHCNTDDHSSPAFHWADAAFQKSSLPVSRLLSAVDGADVDNFSFPPASS